MGNKFTDTTKCSYCRNLIEYDENDLRVGGDHLGLIEIYIDCPECGKPITVGATPSIAAVLNMY